MKTYVVKAYNWNGTYKETINPDNIINEISFSAQLDGGQGQLTLQTNYPFENTSYKGGEYIKVWLYDDFHKSGKQIYYGYISKIERRADQSREYTTFTCLGVGSLAKSILYTNGDTSQTCYNMMTAVRTVFNNNYPNVITIGSISNAITTTQAWSWNYNNCFDCFDTIAKAIGYNWTVDNLGKLNLFHPSSKQTHLVSLGQEVMNITVTNSIEEMVNYYQLARKGGTVATYQNASSQTTYGKKMKYESNSNLNSATTQNAYGNAFISHYQAPKQSIQITLNAEYPYEDIEPGEKISVLNTDLTTLKSLVINKIQYKSDQAILTIDYEDSLWKVIE